MALSQVAQGTQTATLDTEHSLNTQTGSTVYVLAVNLANMVEADIVTLRVKTKVLSGGAAALAFTATFSGAQPVDVVYSEPVPSAHSAEFTLEQTDGVGRNYEWAVLEMD
jgi:hypothetical protein